MRRQEGYSLLELLTVIAILGIVAGVAVPGAVVARKAFAGDAASRKLALVLRAAQGRAEARMSIVRVAVAGDGSYVVQDIGPGAGPAAATAVATGQLGASVQSNYPDGTVEFGPRGLAVSTRRFQSPGGQLHDRWGFGRPERRRAARRMRPLRLMHRQRGFSLIEACVASAVLLLTCAAVAGTLIAALRAERDARQRSVLERTLEAETARLTSLPFFAEVAPPAGDVPGDLRPSSLLAVVFPHARPECNSPAAQYFDGREAGVPGSFITLVEAGGVLLRRETRFVMGEGTDWDVVMPSALDGWAVWASRSIPASTVQIDLTARSANRTASTRLILRALRARTASTAAPADGSAQGG